MTDKRTLTSRVIETRQAHWKLFNFIQKEDFKELPEDARAKLRTSIILNEFTQPFYVWQDPQTLTNYCLDGMHRVRILKELVDEGYDVPDGLPTTFIECSDKNDAARLVLIFSSIYAKITQQGLFDFAEMYDIEISEMRDQVDLPEFSMDRYEQKFDSFQVKNDQDEYEVELDPVEEIIVKEGDLFHLGSHRVLCQSFTDWEKWKKVMDGQHARILITDPPYNIPLSLFKEGKEHADFKMAAGEMSDDQFVSFLQKIMTTAVHSTVPGSIHYIFMDWRHVWHMTEAGRKVYGSAVPKQMCVWAKDRFANGSFYRSQHELCFVFNSLADKHLWNQDLLDSGGTYKDNDELCFIFKSGESAKHLSHLDLVDRIRSNVWKYPSSTSANNPDRYQLANHPTPKPVSMIADAVLDSTNPGDIIIDFFLGSGTAIIAAEKTGRRCYGTEIEPAYVQSIIKRYIQYCSKNAITADFQHINGCLTLNDFTNEKHLRSESDN